MNSRLSHGIITTGMAGYWNATVRNREAGEALLLCVAAVAAAASKAALIESKECLLASIPIAANSETYAAHSSASAGSQPSIGSRAG